MGYITKEIVVVGTQGERNLTALFDSGAGRNYIREILFDGTISEDLGIIGLKTIKEIKLADETTRYGTILIFPKLVIDDSIYEKPAMITLTNLAYDVIIGSFVMQKMGIILNMPEEKIVRISN